MKKAIISALMLATIVIVVPSAEARATTASVTADPQVYVQPGRRYRRGRTRTVVTTRVRWVRGIRYRERIRTTYFANGRTRTVVLSRVRLGGRRVYRNY